MAIAPVSAVKLDGHRNNVSFTNRNKQDNFVHDEQETNIKSSKLAQVPVMVMIAMTPAMMNAKTPVQIMPISNENISEMVAQPAEEVNDATYVARPEQFQQSYPLGVAYLSDLKIQQIKPAIGNEVKANLVLTTYKNGQNANNVHEIYYIKNSYKSNNTMHKPPLVKELIYHNLGKDEYLGILVEERIYKSATSPNLSKRVIGEIRLDDESAQFLLDFNARSTRWNDKTGIKFRETTNRNVAAPKVYNY